MKFSVFGCIVPALLLIACVPVNADPAPDVVKKELMAQMQAFSQTLKEHDLQAQSAFYTPDFTHTRGGLVE